MDDLNATYKSLIPILGEDMEPLDSVQLVETYRRYMRPTKVRVVLLAESHVFTSNDDREIEVPPIPELPNYPTRYARFVYCLGYGERSMTGDPRHPHRDGTPQFWKIFYSCVNDVSSVESFAPILGQTATPQRIHNKILLLKKLMEQGIWLVDTSIVALYRNGIKARNMYSALTQSWISYTRDIVRSANPEHVVCIGKGVASIVSEDLERYFSGKYTVIPQPNAFLKSHEHMENFRKYTALCIPSNKC